MKEINIFWVGCHSEGVLAFKSLLENEYNVSGFLTLNDESFSKRSGGTREYLELCKNHNIPISLVPTIKNEQSFTIINDASPDLLIVLGWSEILPERILQIPTIGTVGAHAALLPHNRGSAPINWALIKDEKTCGNSLMWLDKDVDQGRIIDQVAFNITNYDTCKTLYDKVSVTNQEMIIRLVDRLSHDLPTVMDKENITDEPLLPRRRPKDGLLNWNQSNRDVYNFIRALTHPYPGAFSFLNGKRYFIWKASLLPPIPNSQRAGEIIGRVYSPVFEACGIQVACETGSIIIHEIEDDAGVIYSGNALAEAKMKGTFTDE